MSAQVTYLFGAGASIQALPIVDQLPARFRIFVEEFASAVNNDSVDIKTLRKVAIQIEAHKTVDTYAKILYLSGQSTALWELKLSLGLFFTWEQHRNGVDKRYDLFFANIMQYDGMDPKLPSNIRILSWNYDSQFELSACKFYKVNDTSIIRTKFPIYPKSSKKNYLPSALNKFVIFKLNGSADMAIFTDDELKESISIESTTNEEYLISEAKRKRVAGMKIKEYRDLYKTGYGFHLNYSWEEDRHVLLCREKALESVSESEILVSIGYSFPSMNRIIDSQILSSMKELKKIYVQVTANDVQNVKKKISQLLPPDKSGVPFDLITDLGEFHIPIELYAP
jgi:hypothetical protein